MSLKQGWSSTVDVYRGSDNKFTNLCLVVGSWASLSPTKYYVLDKKKPRKLALKCLVNKKNFSWVGRCYYYYYYHFISRWLSLNYYNIINVKQINCQLSISSKTQNKFLNKYVTIVLSCKNVFHKRHEQLGLHFLVLFLKHVKKLESFVFCSTKAQIFRDKKDIASVPYLTLFGNLACNWLRILKSYGIASFFANFEEQFCNMIIKLSFWVYCNSW